MSFVKKRPRTSQREFGRLIQLLSNLNGRDKLCKAIQNSARLAAFLILAGYTSHDTALAKRLSKLSGAMSQTRKGFRLFKSLVEVEKIVKVLRSDNDLLIKVLTLVSASAYSIYWAFDSKVFLSKVGFVSGKPADYSLLAGKWWFYGLTTMIITQMVLLQRDFAKRDQLVQESATAEELAKTDHSIFIKQLNLVTAVLDMFSCLNQSKRKEMNEGVLSVTGLSSALLVLYKLYPA